MNRSPHFSLLLWGIVSFFMACQGPSGARQQPPFTPIEVFKQGNLVITQIAPHSYVHTSYKQTHDFGYVPCNGMVVAHSGQALVLDTPTTDSVASLLIGWVKDSLRCTLTAVVPTHFHDDCLGGLKAFHDSGIPSFASTLTSTLAQANKYQVPQNSFNNQQILPLGNQQVTLQYFGPGHTPDNVVAYFEPDSILFGGCLIKELQASKGYLGDAVVEQWPATIQKIITAYPGLKRVVPGHGQWGDTSLLHYTRRLFATP